MGKIYKIVSQNDCEALNLSEAQKKAEWGQIVIPEKEAKLAVNGGQLKEVDHVIKK